MVGYVKRMNKLWVFLVVLAILCSNAMTVMAKEQEPENVYRIYSQNGELEGTFGSVEEVLIYLHTSDDTPNLYAYVCDSLGHVHGSKTDTRVERGDKYLEYQGNVYRVDYLVTYCVYCGSEIRRDPIIPEF